MNDNFISDENQEEEIHLRAILDKYLIHWQWFVLGVFMCLSGAYVYLRYAKPLYQASTTILVKDDKKGGMLSELSAFSDMGLGKGMNSNLDNEVEVLKSRTMVEKTVKKLALNVSMNVYGKINDIEVYKGAPIEVDFTDTKPTFYTHRMEFTLVEVTSNTFELETKFKDPSSGLSVVTKKTFPYGTLISTPNGQLTITRLRDYPNANEVYDKAITITVNPLENVVASYLSRLKVDPISKTSSVVQVSIIDPITERAEDFLDNLIEIYNEEATADKNMISENTSKFVANRLLLISQELDGVEKDVQEFKTSNKLTDIETEGKLFIESSSEYNKKRIETEIQLNMVGSILEFIKKSEPSDLLPANIIEGKGEASSLISSYNQLVLERNRILKSATVDNPSVLKMEQQLASLKTNVRESLMRLQTNLTIQKKDLKSQEGQLDSKIEEIPSQERQFRVIARQQKVKEELYLYLLQKREETAISLAATAPNARIIDAAKGYNSPVSPKKNIIYLAALLIGLLIPFSILYLIDLLDTKVKGRFDITQKFAFPFLGDIPHSEHNDVLIDATSRTSTAEAMRIVRTNLDFMLNQVPSGRGKAIFMTSTIAGEGKTFVSANMASIFALSKKKVLLIGMDIRSPKLNEYLGLSISTLGLTNYLSTANASIEDYILPSTVFPTMDILLAGSIPPNPTELLMNVKMDELFEQFKKDYDFILVDTAPVSLVSDTLILAKHADTFVYVVRANHLDKRMLHIPELLYKENKLPNMAVLLNDTSIQKGYGYGYGGYGYGYGDKAKKKPWYKKIFRK